MTTGDLEERTCGCSTASSSGTPTAATSPCTPTCATGERRAYKLETTWLPTYDVPATVAPAGADSPLDGSSCPWTPSPTPTPTRCAPGSRPLADGYRLAGRAASRDPGLPAHLRPAAIRGFAARDVAAASAPASTLLTDPTRPGTRRRSRVPVRQPGDGAAAPAHRNRPARASQEDLSTPRRWSGSTARGAKAASWRPFQLAFVLLNLPALTDPAHPERAADADKRTVDLLFFPTGGGKTEAYLGLTAYTFAIRRLQGVVGSGADARNGTAGVAVLMRYTLRLLTAQQFQRAAALVCAAEVLRRERRADAGGASRSGSACGSAARCRPTGTTRPRRRSTTARDGRRRPADQRPAILACPWCGTPLRGHHDLRSRRDTRRIHLCCPTAKARTRAPSRGRRSAKACRSSPSTRRSTGSPQPGHRHRRQVRPAARGGRRGESSSDGSPACPRHGYRHDDLDAETGCTAAGTTRKAGWPAVTSRPVIRLRPPDLIIQDELHLITGALGTTVGLFEDAVDVLCTWRTPDGTEIGPKIVASTATANARASRCAPCSAASSRCSRRRSSTSPTRSSAARCRSARQHPGRRYLGVCAHGVRLKAAEIRLAEILLLARADAASTSTASPPTRT